MGDGARAGDRDVVAADGEHGKRARDVAVAGADADGVRRAGHGAGVVVVGGEGGVVVVADDGAGFFDIGQSYVEDEAVADFAAVGFSDDSADATGTSDAGIGKGDVPHGSIVSPAEESLLAVDRARPALVDANTAHGVAPAVEDALEAPDGSADGGVVVLGAGGVVPGGRVGIGDVGAEDEICVLKFVAGIHLRGKQVELAGIYDDIRIDAGAGSGPGDGVPVCDIAAVAVRSSRDGYGVGGTGDAGSRPANKVVASANRVREGDAVALVGVGRRVGRAAAGKRAAGEVVGDGIDVGACQRGKIALVEGAGAGQLIAGKVLDGAAPAGDVEVAGGGGGDLALEGEDIRAAAGVVAERAPSSRERRRGAGDRFVERHGDVEVVAAGVDAGRGGGGCGKLDGGGGIDKGETDLQVLEVPGVAAGAGRVEADVQVVDRGCKDKRARGAGPVGRGVVPELLLVEVAVVVVELVMADAGGGFGGLVGVVVAVREELVVVVLHHAAAGSVAQDEARLVDRSGRRIHRAVRVVAVVGRGVVGEDLDVLVAVLLLLLREVDGSVHLAANAVEEGAQVGVVAVEAAGADRVDGLIVAAVRHLPVGAGAVGHVEVLVAGAGRDGAAAGEVHEVGDFPVQVGG